MAISEAQASMLARTLIDELVRSDAIQIDSGRPKAEAGIVKVFADYAKAEGELSREAERTAEQQLRKMGSEAVGLDRQKIVLMIKKKLAEQKGFPL